LSDLVDQSELKTGRRSEGLFFAAATFIRKATQGLGLMTASMLLYLAGFPEGANTTQVSAESVNTLVMLYIPTILFIWMTMLLVISLYRLDRKQHEENLRQLAERNSGG
jgi:GPH family glycoside/pentoside/hexuronide:cation symporter